MKTNTTTIPAGVSWLANKLVAWQKKHQAEADADAIGNLVRLHQLKENGILTEEEFTELKEKLKARI